MRGVLTAMVFVLVLLRASRGAAFKALRTLVSASHGSSTLAFREKRSTYHAVSVEIRFRHFKTGAALWMIYNVFEMRGEAGQVVGYATVTLR